MTYHPDPVIEIDYKFNKDLLMSEFKRLWDLPDPHFEFYKNGERKTNTWKGLRVLGTQTYGKDLDSQLMQEAKRFVDHYGITDDYIALIMWMDKGFELSWHIDDAKVCKSSVNFVLSEDAEPVQFRDGAYSYSTALFDIMQEHAVFNRDKERMLMRVSFKNLTHKDLVNIVCPSSQ
jgi:hypothetical protein